MGYIIAMDMQVTMTSGEDADLMQPSLHFHSCRKLSLMLLRTAIQTAAFLHIEYHRALITTH
jgi:hypothetical protein